jgi:hypothetical protein
VAETETTLPGAIDPDLAGRLAGVARRLVWWTKPEEALKKPLRFVAQVMALGSWSDVQITRSALGTEWFHRVLATPPAGVLDEASWVYWHNVFGIRPVPRLPDRKVP